MLEELWNIGTVAGNRDKLECARHLEQSEELEKAVILYHRAGKTDFMCHYFWNRFIYYLSL